MIMALVAAIIGLAAYAAVLQWRLRRTRCALVSLNARLQAILAQLRDIRETISTHKET